jgi:hypothetical protein
MLASSAWKLCLQRGGVGLCPNVPDSLSLQQFLELLEVGGHGVPDTWHGDSPEQAARATELELHRVGDPGSLWDGVQGIGKARGERPELASYLQLAGRVVGGDGQWVASRVVRTWCLEPARPRSTGLGPVVGPF